MFKGLVIFFCVALAIAAVPVHAAGSPTSVRVLGHASGKNLAIPYYCKDCGKLCATMKVQSVALASGGKGLFRLGLDQKPAARGIKIELIEPDHLPNALGHFNNLLRSDQGTEALAEWRHFEIVSQNRESPFLKSGFFTPTGKDLWRLSGHVAGEVYGHSIEARETWLKFKGDRADELIWSSANSNATHRLHLAPSAHASLAAKPKP